jgi:hypothetical protein
MEGGVGLVNVRGLQFGEEQIREIRGEQLAEVDCVGEKGQVQAQKREIGRHILEVREAMRNESVVREYLLAEAIKIVWVGLEEEVVEGREGWKGNNVVVRETIGDDIIGDRDVGFCF